MKLKLISKGGAEHLIENEISFEALLSVRYLPSLEYGDARVERVLGHRYNRAIRKGWITLRQKWLGCYYAQGLESAPSLDLTLRWIDAQVGYGVFTNAPLPSRAFVGEYAGVLRRRRWFRRWENLYCFDYTVGERKSSSYVIDAQDAGNYVRFINHSFHPNVGLVSVAYRNQIHVVLYAARAIAAGEQLLYDYGDDYWERRSPPRELEPAQGSQACPS